MGYGMPSQMGYAPAMPYGAPPGQMGYGNPGGGGGGGGSGSGSSVHLGGGPGCVLLVSGLPQSAEITPDALFTLFGVYGDVQRVKILFNKRDTALVQFFTASGCGSAIQYLHLAELLQSRLSVSLSRHESISMPKAFAGGPDAVADDSAHLTADYTHHRTHRYRVKPPNPKNLHPPSPVLHVGNLPDGVTEEELVTVFGLNVRSMDAGLAIGLLCVHGR
jgi:RNA recognition motif-containing protein